MSWIVKQCSPFQLPEGPASQRHHEGKSCSEDKITEGQHPAMAVDCGRNVALPNLNLHDYYGKEICLTADQIDDPPLPLRHE